MQGFKKDRILSGAVTVLVVMALSFVAHTQSRASTMGTMNKFYFGRYALQVPTEGGGVGSSYKLIDKKIELISADGKRELPVMLSKAIAEIEKFHRAGYAAYDQTVQLKGGGAIVVSKLARYNLDIYYLTDGNTLYRQVVEDISLKGLDKAIARAKQLNDLIHDRDPDTAPPKGAFAIEGGYVMSPLDTFQEQVSIGLPVSSVPGIHLTFDTQVIGKPEPRLISRYEQRLAGGLPVKLMTIFSGTTLMRKAEREVAGLTFEELLLKTSVAGRTIYSFRLEYAGTPNSSLEPYTVLELSTLEVGQGFNNDREAIEFWDEVVASIERI